MPLIFLQLTPRVLELERAELHCHPLHRLLPLLLLHPDLVLLLIQRPLLLVH